MLVHVFQRALRLLKRQHASAGTRNHVRERMSFLRMVERLRKTTVIRRSEYRISNRILPSSATVPHSDKALSSKQALAQCLRVQCPASRMHQNKA